MAGRVEIAWSPIALAALAIVTLGGASVLYISLATPSPFAGSTSRADDAPRAAPSAAAVQRPADPATPAWPPVPAATPAEAPRPVVVVQGPPAIPLPSDPEERAGRLLEARDQRRELAMEQLNRRAALRLQQARPRPTAPP